MEVAAKVRLCCVVDTVLQVRSLRHFSHGVWSSSSMLQIHSLGYRLATFFDPCVCCCSGFVQLALAGAVGGHES